MSDAVGGIDTLFLHAVDGEYTVVVNRDGDRVLRGRLEVIERDAGPRPARLRVHRGADEDLRSPDEFVELARHAERIRISEQTPQQFRRELARLFDGYQLGEKVATVRTCRRCAGAGRYSPLTTDTAIETGDEAVCRACAVRELDRLSGYRGLQASARERLVELMLDIGDLDRIRNLLSGDLDPELTKFDEMDATVQSVESLGIEDLELTPRARSLFEQRIDELLPVQTLAVRNGVLQDRDQLIVSATATGKTLIGELAGVDRIVRGEGAFLFLVPLVALANQKYDQFRDRYGDIADVTLRVGGSRIRDEGTRFDPGADIVVGTYEGIDHALRTGRDLGTVGTVVIDEVHTIGEPDRGHRLDGLIARLAHETGPATQWVYLSATVGNPYRLAAALTAELVAFEERPVPIERHVTFVNGSEKAGVADKLVTRAYQQQSSKGYRGQTIVFTNSRRRCHQLSGQLDAPSAPYHAGLDYARRTTVEHRFAEQELAAVVTTAALGAGVDFPASQVVFDALAMGIEWLSVQEFEQMLGRAGRPDFHDEGRVYLLVEPDGTYHGGQDRTEDEIAFDLLRGEMEPVTTAYDDAIAMEETLANVVVAGRDAKQLNDNMIGEIDTERALAHLLDADYVEGLTASPLGRVITEQFLSPEEATLVLDGVHQGADPDDVVADLELRDS